jgi:hypothetical protein
MQVRGKGSKSRHGDWKETSHRFVGWFVVDRKPAKALDETPIV